MKASEKSIKGCSHCKKIVYSGGNLPLIAENFKQHNSLHQCLQCKSYWVYTERFAKIVQPDELKDDFPVEYAVLQNKE